MIEIFAHSGDPDQTPSAAVSDQGLYCLLGPVCPNTLGEYGSLFNSKPLKNLNPLLKNPGSTIVSHAVQRTVSCCCSRRVKGKGYTFKGSNSDNGFEKGLV